MHALIYYNLSTLFITLYLIILYTMLYIISYIIYYILYFYCTIFYLTIFCALEISLWFLSYMSLPYSETNELFRDAGIEFFQDHL